MIFFGTTRWLAGFPRVYFTWRQETRAPYRRCERALAVRVPWTGKSLVVGRWHRRLPGEDEAYAALGFHPTPYLEESDEVRAQQDVTVGG